MEFRIVSNFRMQAVRASFFGFPLSSQKKVAGTNGTAAVFMICVCATILS
jgi:hypothetical protein